MVDGKEIGEQEPIPGAVLGVDPLVAVQR